MYIHLQKIRKDLDLEKMMSGWRNEVANSAGDGTQSGYFPSRPLQISASTPFSVLPSHLTTGPQTLALHLSSRKEEMVKGARIQQSRGFLFMVQTDYGRQLDSRWY